MVNQVGQSAPTNNAQQPNANAKDRIELEKQIKEELKERSRVTESRLSGADGNINSTNEEINKCGVFSWASGHSKTLKEQLVRETAYRDKAQEEKDKFDKVKTKVNELLKNGDLEGAKSVLEKGVDAYKNKIATASNQVNSAYNQTREDLKNVDSFLANAETVCEVSKEVAKGTAIAAATIGTGGLAGVALGVAVGTGTGAVVNYGNAAQEAYLFESKNASQAFSEANSKTLVDAKDSVVGALGAGAGGALAGKVIGKAVSVGAKIGSGVIAGGTSAAVTTGINTTENLVNAHIEFNKIYGEQTKNMKPEEVASLKQEFFKSKGLTGEQILKSTIVSVAAGMASGGSGAGSNATRGLTKSVTNKVGILAAEVLVTGAVAVGSEYVLTGETNIAKTFASTVQGAVIGELTANKNNSKPNTNSQPAQNPQSPKPQQPNTRSSGPSLPPVPPKKTQVTAPQTVPKTSIPFVLPPPPTSQTSKPVQTQATSAVLPPPPTSQTSKPVQTQATSAVLPPPPTSQTPKPASLPPVPSPLPTPPKPPVSQAPNPAIPAPPPPTSQTAPQAATSKPSIPQLSPTSQTPKINPKPNKQGEAKNPIQILDQERKEAHLKKTEDSHRNERLLQYANFLKGIKVYGRVEVYGNGNEIIRVNWIKFKGKYDLFPGIPKDSPSYKYLTSKPGTKEHEIFLKCEKMLAEAYFEAKGFQPDSHKHQIPDAITVEGSKTFGMEAGVKGFGIRISSDNLDYLFKALEDNDSIKVKNNIAHLKAELAHEMVHNIRTNAEIDSSDEIATHAVQYLSSWEHNPILKSQLEDAVQAVRDDKVTDPRYDTSMVKALETVQKKLSECKEASYKPQDFSPKEIEKSLASINPTNREKVIKTICAEVILTKKEDLN